MNEREVAREMNKADEQSVIIELFLNEIESDIELMISIINHIDSIKKEYENKNNIDLSEVLKDVISEVV